MFLFTIFLLQLINQEKRIRSPLFFPFFPLQLINLGKRTQDPLNLKSFSKFNAKIRSHFHIREYFISISHFLFPLPLPYPVTPYACVCKLLFHSFFTPFTQQKHPFLPQFAFAPSFLRHLNAIFFAIFSF